MGSTRRWLVGAAAVALVVVGAACEPKAQMHLDLAVEPTGTYEVLTHKLTLDITVPCTRATSVAVSAAAASADPQHPLLWLATLDGRSDGTILFRCSGPGDIASRKTEWRVSSAGIAPNPLRVMMMAVTPGFVADPIDYDLVYVTQNVTITRIMCWPTPTTCTRV
jgi:hypothetical protein